MAEGAGTAVVHLAVLDSGWHAETQRHGETCKTALAESCGSVYDAAARSSALASEEQVSSLATHAQSIDRVSNAEILPQYAFAV